MTHRLGRWWPRWLSWRRAVVLSVTAVVLVAEVTLLCTIWITWPAEDHLYPAENVPAAPVALVLGAQVYRGNVPSPFLAGRLALAKQLFDAGKVRAILVSGDNSRPDYDEPTGMRQWLIDAGVPERRVVEDYAGFDTYDSCLRAKRIFGVRQAIVITQSYHIARAVTLCRRLGVDAAGVGDDTVRHYRGEWWRASVRERGACVKAVLDLASRRDPVFLGPQETSVQDAVRD